MKRSRGRSARADAAAIREAACALAVAARADETFDAEQMLATCIFFESYIAHGTGWVRKHMKLMADDRVVVPFKVIRP
jgi:hypothetical protein